MDGCNKSKERRRNIMADPSYWENSSLASRGMGSMSAYDKNSPYYNKYAYGNQGFNIPNPNYVNTNTNTGTGFGSSYSPNWTQYMNQYMPVNQTSGGMPSGPIGTPSQVPVDQAYVQQYLYPAMMQQYMAQLKPEEYAQTKQKGVDIGMATADKLGMNTPAEINPSLKNSMKSSWTDAMSQVASNASRSGMPLSSVNDKMKENITQQYLEGLTRGQLSAEDERKKLLAQFIQAFSR
jgi:hypothetical protein